MNMQIEVTGQLMWLEEQSKGLRGMMDHYGRQSYVWYREALNKAQRRLRRQLARWKSEHGKTRVKVQAQASVQAPEQSTQAKEGAKYRLPIRQASNPERPAQEKAEGKEDGRA